MTGKSMTMRAQLTMKTGVLAGGVQPGSHVSGRQRQRLSSMTNPTETNFARLQARADQLWQANPRLSKTQVGRTSGRVRRQRPRVAPSSRNRRHPTCGLSNIAGPSAAAFRYRLRHR